MLKRKLFASTFLILLIFAITCNVKAETPAHVYKYSYSGIEVLVENPFEAYPNQTITVNITTKALTNLIVNYTQVDLYTLNNLTKEEILFYTIFHISIPRLFSGDQWLNKTYEVHIPEYASNVIYGKLRLKWTLKGTEEGDAYEREPTFVMSYLRNLELERLRDENARLKENVTDLNNTLTELRNNLTEIQNRYEGELSGTRSTIVVLAVATVFFVATTAYLVLRKPKQSW
ncbi:MAG: hypothetical protein ACPL1Z_03620 [Candidatus Bathyarchaeales archaeon]|jgi:transcriptional regulator of met regulon